MNDGYLFVFFSTHDAIAARGALRERCGCITLPTPRAITASCGITALVPVNALEEARRALDELGLLDAARTALYRADGAGGYAPLPL